MKRHTVAGFIGIFLVSLSVWQIWSAGKGLDILQVQRDAVPVTIVIPKAGPRDEMPVVLLGHGFAGSGVFMRAFAYPLAYAGYAAVLWDFDGHGRNPNPLPSSASGGDLVQNAEAALAAALSLGIGDPSRVAILGHSMGSGVAMTFGQRYPHTAATIAVSPVGTQVTPELPRNLLLLAGENEPAFQRNAQLRLVEAGGSGGSFQAGTARQMQVIPMVEHISIVFSPLTHRAAVEWLDAVFGVQPSAVAYTDRRVIWYGLGVLGALLAAVGFIPPSQTRSDKTPTTRRSLLSLLVGALGATLLLWGLDLVGLSLARSFGLVVGGYLLVWFSLAGTLALLILDQWRDWLEILRIWFS